MSVVQLFLRIYNHRNIYLTMLTYQHLLTSCIFTARRSDVSAQRRCPFRYFDTYRIGGSVAEWLVCAGLRRRRARVKIAAAKLSGNSLRQTVHTHRASVHQAAKLAATLLRVARITAGLAESNVPPGLWARHLQADCQEPGSAPEPCAR